MKKLIVLVGPKGAGKSTIGHFLASDLGVYFLRVERVFLEVRERLGPDHAELERQGFEAVLASVDAALSEHSTVCIESTGASTMLPWYLSSLEAKASVLLVHVLATPEQCLQRIQTRDASIHIPVSDEQVQRINAIAMQVSLPWNAEIDNRGAFDPGTVRETIRRLLTIKSQSQRPGGA